MGKESTANKQQSLNTVKGPTLSNWKSNQSAQKYIY